MTANETRTHMHICWLPLDKPSLLIGFIDRFGPAEGMATILDAEAAGRLAGALENNQSLTHSAENGTTVRLRPSNRGEPYREGMELSIEAGDHEQHSVFLDDGDVGGLANLLQPEDADGSAPE